MKKIIKKNQLTIILGILFATFISCSHQQNTLDHLKLRENILGFQALVATLPYPPKISGIIYGDAHLENFVLLKESETLYPNDFDSLKNAELLSDFYRLLLSTEFVFSFQKHPTLSLEHLKKAYQNGLVLKSVVPSNTSLPLNSSALKIAKFNKRKEFQRELTAEELKKIQDLLHTEAPHYKITSSYLRVKKSGGSKGKKRFQIFMSHHSQNLSMWMEFKEQELKSDEILNSFKTYIANNYFNKSLNFVLIDNSLYLKRELETFKKDQVIDIDLEMLMTNPSLVEKEFLALGQFHKAINSADTINLLLNELSLITPEIMASNLEFLKKSMSKSSIEIMKD